MPRISTIPILYDEVNQINISRLKRWGYLEPNCVKSGVLNWSRHGEVYSSISITANNYDSPYIELSYTWRKEEAVNYRVDIVTRLSNLGKGELHFFRCPHTYKLCRKLYIIGKYFLHRDAFTHTYYDSQVQSKNGRSLLKLFTTYYGSDKAYQTIYSKHFKKYYNGKPTKRYKKALRQIEASEAIPYEVIERCYIA